MNSPIKYHGGKGCDLAKKISQYFPDNNSYSIYVEPFGGGASLLFRKIPSPVEVYNDLEKNIYSLMKVLGDKELFLQFKEKCELALYSRDLNEEFKCELKKDNLSLLERAYKFFYVNRTSFNGIGGFAVTTNYIRRNTSKSISDFLGSIDGLPDVHARLHNVIIENKNAFKLIPLYDRGSVFIYADPPYHQSTRSNARYEIDMDNDEQEQFIDMMLNIKNAKVMISGYDCNEYERLLSKYKKIDVETTKRDGNNKRNPIQEFLWINY